MRVTLIDRNNYHQFQPLLYQVATSQLAVERHRVLAAQAVPQATTNVDVKLGEVASIDPATRTVTLADGERYTGDALVARRRARGRTSSARPGAEEHAFPLYSLDDADAPALADPRACSRTADRDPALHRRRAR